MTARISAQHLIEIADPMSISGQEDALEKKTGETAQHEQHRDGWSSVLEPEETMRGATNPNNPTWRGP